MVLPAVSLPQIGPAQKAACAMGRWILLAMLIAAALPASAAKRVTVAQLEQVVTADAASHKPDADMVRQFGGMELTERLTDATLDRLTAQLVRGSQAMVALQLLADQSAFLNPPASELAGIAVPDAAAQQAMLHAAKDYVAQTLPHLPNLLATRTTIRYEDTPRSVKQGDWPVRAGLHLVDSEHREISIREEQDYQSAGKDSAAWHEQSGLTSGGEFGSTLGMVMSDLVNGHTDWAYWEQTGAGAVAVFHYSVPRSVSHFEIIGSRQGQAALEGHAAPDGGSRGTAGVAVTSTPVASNASIVRNRPGYHGSLWVEPASGTILRITIEADAKDSAPFRRAAMMVEYGPVPIGDRTIVCPLRSLALSMAIADAHVLAGDAPTVWLNENVFTAYHRFGSTVRVLPDSAKQ
jgi:hypothetical protein